MKIIETNKFAQVVSAPPLTPEQEQQPQTVRTSYRVMDQQNQPRGTLMLSELESQVLIATLKKGDLLVANFKILKA